MSIPIQLSMKKTNAGVKILKKLINEQEEGAKRLKLFYAEIYVNIEYNYRHTHTHNQLLTQTHAQHTRTPNESTYINAYNILDFKPTAT